MPDGDAVAVEAHAPMDWFAGLPARGHRLRPRPSWGDGFGHAHLIAVEDDHLAAAADPRTGRQRKRVLNQGWYP